MRPRDPSIADWPAEVKTMSSRLRVLEPACPRAGLSSRLRVLEPACPRAGPQKRPKAHLSTGLRVVVGWGHSITERRDCQVRRRQSRRAELLATVIIVKDGNNSDGNNANNKYAPKDKHFCQRCVFHCVSSFPFRTVR